MTTYARRAGAPDPAIITAPNNSYTFTGSATIDITDAADVTYLGTTHPWVSPGGSGTTPASPDIEAVLLVDDVLSKPNPTGPGYAEIPVVTTADPLRAPDMIGFYRWSAPTIAYNPATGDVWAGGVGRSREQKIARLNPTSRAVEVVGVGYASTSDDHDIPAFLLEDGAEALVALTDHDHAATVAVRTSPLKADPRVLNAPANVANASAANVSYSQIYKRATSGATDGRLLMFRASSSWWMARSADKGATWDVASKAHGNTYQVSRQSTGSVIHVATTDPTESDPCVIRYFKVSLNTGVATNAVGTALASGSNIFTAPANTSTALYPNTNMDTVLTSSGTVSHRLYDISRTGESIAISRITRASIQPSSDYIVLRRATSGTSNAWVEETVCPSGRVFGGAENAYYGGMCFDGTDALYLVREVSGVWTLERWVRTGPAYPNANGSDKGTWTRERTLHTVTGTPGTIGVDAAGKWLARPMVPQGAEGLGLCVVSELRQYDGTATNYVSDLVLPTPTT